MEEEQLILVFDLSGDNWTVRKKIWRELQESGSKLAYRSHWTLPLNERNVIEFKRICEEIRKFGGKAEVIKGVKVV
ncbi:MAG: hypothetical protein QMD36_01830 [Candidatus Aenigmarchaeota archaeon]|nr:hypothetical protein [Candidatus Aenigmarchaeota archaeon]